MDQTILHRYFEGVASRNEEEMILQWVEESEENRKVFNKERMLYDIALFAKEENNIKETTKNVRTFSLLKWSTRIAAFVLVILSCGLLINEYRYNQSAQLQTVTVPAGQRAQIVLADGTKIWLNAKSTLTYATGFGRKSRNVELDGEAYFEVAKNEKIPFFVNTEYNKIRVVGTSFNVTAYKGSNEFETTLVEGIVDVYNRSDERIITRLTKDEFLVAHGNSYQKKNLHSYEYLRWKEGLYCFDDTPFKYLLDRLEKYYSVEITVEYPAILDYQCTGKFKENDGVEHILKVIQKDHPFTYTINENKDSIVIR